MSIPFQNLTEEHNRFIDQNPSSAFISFCLMVNLTSYHCSSSTTKEKFYHEQKGVEVDEERIGRRAGEKKGQDSLPFDSDTPTYIPSSPTVYTLPFSPFPSLHLSSLSIFPNQYLANHQTSPWPRTLIVNPPRDCENAYHNVPVFRRSDRVDFNARILRWE